ncbi:MAG TPA: hypothetical protein VJW95_01565 [Dissulfurispiraceae bacterium]|nr:hypothetical protein [Dissulfurispiraceae bacterium]
MNLKLILKIILYFPGTFAHELAHWACALLFGSTEGFNIIPRRDGDHLIFGSVSASVRYKAFGIFIGAAPLVWWVVLYMLLKYYIIMHAIIEAPKVYITFSFERFASPSLADLLFLWLITQLFWAGRLSAQDIKTCLAGLFSVSGAILIVSAGAIASLIL